MLKPLTTNYKNREITLECTHKKVFPPPQMYGHTPEDIDNLWKQGVIDQNQHQHLRVWKENCGLMVMGPRCLDCKLALKQNPRPGRPHVIETEPWLAAKDRIYWDDMKAGKATPEAEEVVSEKTVILGGENITVVSKPNLIVDDLPDPKMEIVPPEPKKTLMDALQNPDEILAEASEEVVADETAPESESKPEEGLGDDILDALAED